MRTTVNIDDDLLAAARALAEAQGISLGKAISRLIRRGLQAKVGFTRVEGFPVFRVPEGARSFGPEEVEAADEADDAPHAELFRRR